MTDMRNTNIVCATCGRTGHLAANCFQKIGYPFWWGKRPRRKIAENQSCGHIPSTTGDRRGLLSTPTIGRSSEQARVDHDLVSCSMITSADHLGFSGFDDHQAIVYWVSYSLNSGLLIQKLPII